MNHKIYVFFIFIVMIFSIDNICSKTLPLKNKIIVIDPGHGGIDKGASYYNNNESELVLNISKILKKELEKEGATIFLTREGDYDLSKPNAKRRKKSDFDNRIKYINDINPDIVLSIHLNASKNNNYSGMQILYNKSETFAKILYKTLNIKRKNAKRNDVYILNNIKQDIVLIEWGFISNYQDLIKLTNDDNIEKQSQFIVKGIINYFQKY